jgi:methylmalonyl-CoA mutase C-terminal domain/subunit
MGVERIVVGATGEDDAARLVARRLRDEGHEIVFVGGHQTSDHLARATVAEDAVRLVVDTDDRTLAKIARACADLGASDVTVEHSV